MADPVVSLINMLERVEIISPVVVGLEYRLLFVPPRGNVVDSAGIFYPKWSGHGEREYQKEYEKSSRKT